VRSGVPPADQTWFGQPPGLTILLLTEMTEKFSFYGMRALLVYYMIKQLHFSQDKASLVYGLYSGLIYFTPIFGGFAADRWLGKGRSVVIGGTIMALGHFLMTVGPLFYVALAIIAVGNGLYLPSIPSQIGALYPHDDPRRGNSYNIYYAGVNLGAFIAPLICGTLGEVYGWDFGFAAAGVGMCVGVAVYVGGRRFLPQDAPRGCTAAAPSDIQRDSAGASRAKKALLLLAIGIAVVIFRGAYEQVGNTVALWADTSVERRIGHWLIPGSWLQSFNPLLVMLLTPVLLHYWSRAAQHNADLSSAKKMAVGALVAAFAYLVLGAAAWQSGLGLFARLAPERYRATTIAAWYFAAFAGNLLAGSLGTVWSRIAHDAFFALMAVVAIIAAVLLYALDASTREVELLDR